MVRFLIVIMSLIFLSSSVYGQEKYIYKVNSENEVEETNDPESNGFSSYYGGVPHAVKWIPYESPCIDCEALVTQYNDSMQDLLEIRSWDRFLVQSGSEDFRNRTRTAPDPNATEAEMAQALSSAMATQELLDEKIPELKRALAKLEKTVKYLRAQIALCEQKCKIPYEKTIIGRMPLQPGEIRIRGEEANVPKPELPFDWKGPYLEVCEACRKLAARLNELPEIARYNSNEIDAKEAKRASLVLEIQFQEGWAEEGDKSIAKDLRNTRKELKEVDKRLKTLRKDREKIIDNFNKTLEMYNDCIKKYPVQKTACAFPNDNSEKMTIGPNDQYGSSAQAAKEIRDKATGAAKGAATKALSGLLGFNLGGGGGGGPKMDKDRSRGKFTRISAGDTDLDVRASWRDDQLIVSTKIDDTPDNGTFHAQWIEDRDGNTYLPVRYLIYNMYRDWKLTVSWTEDHYVDGEHVFHDEGQEITTGRDHLGTWTIFEGIEGVANSIWGMLGFETAVKGVKHLGAVYDLSPTSFPDDCQLQLVTHISEPKNDPVTSIPVLGSLFKHVDESRRRPETIILVQPHIIDTPED